MNPVVLQIASGNAFFVGIGMTVFAFALRLWLTNRVWLSLLTIAIMFAKQFTGRGIMEAILPESGGGCDVERSRLRRAKH